MEGTPTQARQRFGNPMRLALGATLLSLALAAPAGATHFRYGHVTWKPVSGTTVEFTVQNVWRRDAYTTGNNRCVNTSFAAVACTGPGGSAGVGDIIHERQGGTTFDFGDGTSTFGRTISGTKALLYLVTSIDPVNNWLFGLALDHDSFPTLDTTIDHTYASPTTTYTAKIEDCCRISACAAPNAHLSNPDNGYSVTTVVDFTSPDSSPVSSVPPIVLCPQEGTCSFNLPVSDNEGDPVTFRLATALEMNVDEWSPPATGPGLGQPGAGGACANIPTVDSGSGDYDWNTASCRLAGSPGPVPPAGGCNNSSLHTLYSTQVFIEQTGKPAESAVDFLIELLPICPTFNEHSPAFVTPPTPLCGTAQSINPGGTLSFTVQADDGDASDSLTLNAVGLPAGAAMVPGLPTSGKPVSSAFTWTPTTGQLGQHVITFTATDQCGEQALCAVTVDVSLENCTDGSDNDGDGLADCADLDCNGTPCDDGNFCTVSDTCQAGTCGAGPARDCGDGNQCTADSCDEGNDTCVNTAVSDGTSCNDGAFCTTNDSCQAGNCQAGPARDCGDGNACTADSCDEGSDQCVNDGAPLEGQSCEDGAFCSTGDTCQSGTCAAGPPRDCGDANACTADSCDEGSDQCVNDGAPLEGQGCDDGAYCTTGDSCTAGTCAGAARDCGDGNACTADSCDEGSDQCVNDGAPLEGQSCEDGAFCSTGDTCQSGSCAAGPPRDCGDGNVCTADSCDEGSDQCVNDGVPLEGQSCEDGAFCSTGDTCQSGSCAAGAPRDCGDGNACTSDSCDEGNDLCVNDGAPLEGQGCDDGLFCTTGDTCAAGACGGAARDCSDGTPCTVDTCDENADQCTSSSGPAPTCHRSGRATLVVRDSTNPKQDRVVWRWTRGNTPPADLGDPVDGSTSYTLCVYDESAGSTQTSLALSSTIAPGGTCGDKPCWRKFGANTVQRVRYKDKDANGLKRLVVKAHSTGQARVVFTARGNRAPTFPAPAAPGLLAQDGKVRVQMVNSAGKCWEAEYTAPAVRNRSDLFRDKCGTGSQGTCPQ